MPKPMLIGLVWGIALLISGGLRLWGELRPPSPAGAFCAGSLDRFSAVNPFRHLACVDDCVWGGRRDARIKDV
jgi:hypothetical protein